MPDRSVDKVAVTVATEEQLAGYAAAQARVREFDTPRLYDAADPRSRVFFAMFDGTGNDANADPGHITNVGLLASQMERLAAADPHIGAVYKEGPGTQGGLTGLLDAVTGTTYRERVESMYDQFADQSARWLRDDPQARISVVSVGFSRGAEQAAGFARLVEERGIQAAPSIFAPGGRFTEEQVAFTQPPLRSPGQVAQALGLYDPVGTGAPTGFDRRPPPSVLSGLQICAADEFRRQFPSTAIIGQGLSDDGRFLGVTTAGAHSDIGGGYLLHGLSHRNFNLMAEYLNGVLGEPAIKTLEVPAAPDMSVIHDTPWFYLKRDARETIGTLEPTGGKALEEVNPVLAELYARQHVAPPPAPPAEPAPAIALLSLDDTTTAAFEDLGRNAEVAQVLAGAARELEAGAAGRFALHDTNGNPVGHFDIVPAAPEAPPADGAVRLALDLNQPAFGADRDAALAQAILRVADQVAGAAGDTSFTVKADNGQVLGEMVMQRPAPAPERQQVAEAAAPAF